MIHMGRSDRRIRVLWAATGVLFSACYIHTSAKPIDSHVRRPPTCPEAVALFAAAAEVNRQYVEVARISVWHPADMAVKPVDEQLAQRKKAAEFGANGLILQHPLDQLDAPDQRSLAIFISADSARAAEICAARGHGK